MIECTISNLSKSYGVDLIFENVTFDIKTNERIGLIGPNGCGKTTLLKIILGKEYASSGDVFISKNNKVSYLDQIPNYSSKKLVIDILKDAFKEVFELEKKIEISLNNMNTLQGDQLEKEMNKYANYQELYEKLDGYNVETLINKVITGLKIEEQLLKNPFNKLSGGEKTRVMLGKILLEKPDILMLDEPTNHLDLESIEWLETYLKEYLGSVIVVSHDRYFLDNTCNKIIELSKHKSYVYNGNYSYYVVERERRFLLELKVYLAQERKIKRMEEQIKRYRIWGVMRDSEKMFKRAKELERRLEKIERLDKPIKDNPKLKIKNIQTKRSGKRVLEASNISKSFSDKLLFNNVDIEIILNDKLAILGNNGTGKTTLIKMLLDDYNLKEESLYKWGSKINIGYLPQEIKFENDNQTILKYFTDKYHISDKEGRSELAKVLFTGDDVFKAINALSGGEKSKLKICELNYEKVNFLILDEPTNHLDIDSREILEDLLLEFNGTILFISHDRYFIKKIASRIGEILNHTITYYEGDYDYFRYLKSKVKETNIPKTTKNITPTKQKSTINKYLTEKELETLDKEIKHLEEEMTKYQYDASKLWELTTQKDLLNDKYIKLLELLDESE